MVELTVAVAIIASVAAIGFNIANNWGEKSRLAKLEKDVRTLNSASALYQASGGTLIGAALPQQVLDKIKTSASTASAETVVALQGRFVDPRIRAVMTDASSQGEPRAVWNTTTQRFTIEFTGVGVREFTLDGEVALTTEDRATSVAYASNSNWVWDYTDRVATRRSRNEHVALGNITPTAPSGAGAGSPTQLPAPTFSLPGGIYPISNYPMPLTLSVPPEFTGAGTVLYQISDGPWTVYTGSFAIPPSVSTTINTYFTSGDPDTFTDSPVVFETYDAHIDRFSGEADGTFKNAQGNGNIDVEYLDEDHTFEWGTEFTPGGFTDPNEITFEGQSFTDVAPEEEFLLGSVTYFNGTTFIGTTPDTVELEIALDFSLPDVSETLTFQLDLESTTNHAWQSDDENADFVRLSNIQTNFTTQLNGQTYYLNLSFGEHTANGFTTIDEFHVHENATASGNVYGTLTATPPGN